MRSIWNDLLFLHGHIADATLARRLAAEPKLREQASRKEKAPHPPRAETSRIAPCGGGACTPT